LKKIKLLSRLTTADYLEETLADTMDALKVIQLVETRDDLRVASTAEHSDLSLAECSDGYSADCLDAL
jgi:hypothetical protein